MTRSQPSIQRRILTSFSIVLLVLTTALTVSSWVVIHRRITTDLDTSLSRTLNVGWNEYASRPNHALTVMRYMNALPEFQDTLGRDDSEGLREFLNHVPNVDFAAFVLPSGEVFAHTNPDQIGTQAPLAYLVSEALRSGSPLLTTEKMDYEAVAREAPSSAFRIPVFSKQQKSKEPVLNKGLVQIVVLPVENGQQSGALMAGVLLNNTSYIPRSYTNRVPNSYLSISCEGVRIVSNIRTKDGYVATGTVQPTELVEQANLGDQVYGPVDLGPEEHYVVSEPIVNSKGEVVGVLSLGLPPMKYVELQRESLTAMLVCAAISFLFALGVAGLVARNISRPLVWLGGVVRRLTRFSESHEFQRALTEIDEQCPPMYSREMTELYSSFSIMAHELEEQYFETMTYLEQLQVDRKQLQQVTAQLQDSKALLEKRVEEQTEKFRQMVVELQQANRLKSQFLATMSHELRTPLNSIIGFSEMMVDGLVGETNATQKEYLENILTSARHLLQLINDMLDLSRIEQGRITLDRQPILVSDLASSVEGMVGHLAHEGGLTLEVNVPDDLPCVEVDATRIKQVLYNLLSNAIKFTGAGGKVWVRSWAAEDEVAVEVGDTGIGIKPEDQEAVFNEFVQAESAYHRRFEGVGLGLPLSKKLVELHGGRIELESQPGVGTKVRFFLPRDMEKGGVDVG